MVSLIEQSWMAQIDVARAVGRDERSVRRYQRWSEGGGLACSAARVAIRWVGHAWKICIERCSEFTLPMSAML